MSLILIATETGISKKDFDNMLDFEKGLFEDMMKCIDSSDKKLNEGLNGKEKSQSNDLVVFLDNVEEFVGLGGEKMGGFTKGQIANIPKEIAKILIDDKKVELVSD